MTSTLHAQGLCEGALAQATLNPTADAYVQGGKNAAKNFGTDTELKAHTNAKAAKNFDSYLNTLTGGAGNDILQGLAGNCE